MKTKEFTPKTSNSVFVGFRNYMVFSFFCIGYYGYDLYCAWVSKIFKPLIAFVVMYLTLFALAIFLVWGHVMIREKFNWDVLGLSEIRELQNKEFPWYSAIRRFKRWLANNPIKFFWIGPIVFGPHVVAVAQRKNEDWWLTLMQYIIPGTMISVVFWLLLWEFFWFLLDKFIIPIFTK